MQIDANIILNFIHRQRLNGRWPWASTSEKLTCSNAWSVW